MNTVSNDYLPFGIKPTYNYPEDEAADLIGFKPGTLQARRTRGEGPPFIKVGRLVRYPGHLLIAWLESRVVENTQRFGRTGG